MLKKLLRKDIVLCVAIGAKVSDPASWLDYQEKQMRGDRSHAEMIMDITTPNWTRTLEIESDVEGKNQALSTIQSPAKEKGIRTLRIENNMWNYFPKLKRKVAVSSSMLLASWMGSDFTNDDILKASSMADDYNHKFIDDEKEYKVIEGLAKSNSKVMWPKIVSYNSKVDCLPRMYKYYDKEGKLRRTLTFDKVKTFDGHKVPTHWEMVPEEDKTKKTVIDYKSLTFNVKFKGDHFSQKNLTGK
jgi:outer membrane lipoprotein-sorting protein